jgi:hypothetical protein
VAKIDGSAFSWWRQAPIRCFREDAMKLRICDLLGRPFPAIAGLAPSVSRNITSDPDQGLGKWTDDQIKDAITKAVRPNGEKLAGPMAYYWYAKITPDDLDAIVAFMRTIKPVKLQQ